MTDRRAALVAGVALLLMAVLAPFTILGVIDHVVAGEEPASGTAFRLAVAGVLVIALLDLVIAAALWRLFLPVDRRLAALAGGARAAYGVVYLVAIGFLATGEPRTSRGTRRSGTSDSCSSACTWCSSACSAGARASSRASWACLVAVAGAAYAVDSVGVLLSESYDADLAAYLFVGEVVLMLWLLWWGLGVSRRRRAARP